MDKFQKSYIWFVLLLSALSFPTRLFLANKTAYLTAKRLQTGSMRRFYIFAGWLFIACGFTFYALPVFRSFGRNTVFLFLVFCLVSGAEFLSNTYFPQQDKLVSQNRIFGFLYLGVALLAAFMLQQLPSQ